MMDDLSHGPQDDQGVQTGMEWNQTRVVHLVSRSLYIYIYIYIEHISLPRDTVLSTERDPRLLLPGRDPTRLFLGLAIHVTWALSARPGTGGQAQ